MREEIDILFERFLSDDCTKEEFDRLMLLLQKNKHEDAVRKMLQKVYENPELSISKNESNQFHLPVALEPKKHRYLKVLGVAASAVIVLGISYFFYYQKRSDNKKEKYVNNIVVQSSSDQSVVYITQKGEQKHLVLADGTNIWLNAESKIEVPETFDKKQRVVFLKGEAFFDVEHAKNWPFIIHTENGISTRVLGTAFDVKAYANQNVSVSVKRGRVQVSRADKVLATLSVGERIKMEQTPDILPKVEPIKQDHIAVWTVGKLSYDAMQIKDILQDLERIYNITINLQNQTMANDVITIAADKKDGIETILRTLCTLTNTNYNYQNGTYNIY